MPYIDPKCRELVHEHGPARPGELNYILTRICDAYIKNTWDGYNYTSINEVIGVLECAKMELYRRMAAPYEDKKIKENGDVYDETA